MNRSMRKALDRNVRARMDPLSPAQIDEAQKRSIGRIMALRMRGPRRRTVPLSSPATSPPGQGTP